MLAAPMRNALLIVVAAIVVMVLACWWANRLERGEPQLVGAGVKGDYVPPAPSDYVVIRGGYELGFNADTHQPNWVAYRLTKDKLLNPKADRSNDFRPDAEIKESA